MAIPQEQNNNIEEKDIQVTENQDIQVTDLIKKIRQLIDLQAQCTIVSACKASREVKQGLETKLQGVKNWVNSEERKYGARQGEAKAIIAECSETYNKIYETYNEYKNSSVARRETYQTQEQYEMMRLGTAKLDAQSCKDNIKVWKTEMNRIENSPEFLQYSKIIEDTKKEAKKAIDIGDIRSAELTNNKLKENQEKQNALYGHYKESYEFDAKKLSDLKQEMKSEKQNIKDLRNYIKEQETNIKDIAKSSINAINVATNQKDRDLAVIKRQNALSKFFSSIMAKVGGAKKFASNVTEPLRETITKIKEEKLPELKQEIDKVGQGAKQVGQTVVATAELAGECAKYVGVKAAIAVENIDLKQVPGKIVEGVEKGKQTVREIVDAGKEKKYNFLQKVGKGIADKMENKIQELAKKKEAKEQSAYGENER